MPQQISMVKYQVYERDKLILNSIRGKFLVHYAVHCVD